MNTIKNMNFLHIRKMYHSIFARILNFWLITGIGFFTLLILLFAFISPLSNQYAKTYKNVMNLSVAFERYAAKKDLYNESWIASKRQEAELYNKEVEKCKSFLKGRDDHLESVFVIQDTEKRLMKVEDEALWKNEYGKRISALVAKLEANHVALDNGALPFQNWGAEIPVWDNILSAQKRFWIIEAIVNIILDNNGITKLEKITFKESCCSYDLSFAHIYTAIPITMKVELQADRIQFLLHDILESSIPFVIEGVNISSTNKILNPNSSMENNNASSAETNNNLPHLITDITIDAYVIDYKT
ncbi:MAG: hypothetical protein CV087_05755 [Candidatus Brocadia sp. WS118]|nr:MAG: hypothetical protein CV087_05755 [Candidatus Brocadia sp. WS118]